MSSLARAVVLVLALVAMVSQTSLAGGLTSGGRLSLPVVRSSGSGRATLTPVPRPVAMELTTSSYFEAELAQPGAFPADAELALSLALEKTIRTDITELRDLLSGPPPCQEGESRVFSYHEVTWSSDHEYDVKLVVVEATCDQLWDLLDKLEETLTTLQDIVDALGEECQGGSEQQGDTDLCDLDLTCAPFAIRKMVADYCASGSW
jgi:hypothetical protein